MEVKNATSFDERFDPANVLNADPNKFWTTTGLYPQEILLENKSGKNLSELQFLVTGAKKICVEGSSSDKSNDFKKIGESKELTQKSGGLVQDSLSITPG